MREIKFRAWWDGRNEPVTPHMVEWEELCAEHFPYGFWPMREDSGFTLMQYTGLKDKNGVEVYEGDIVRKTGAEWNHPVGFTQVGYLPIFLSTDTVDFEVIGNIYENAELLE